LPCLAKWILLCQCSYTALWCFVWHCHSMSYFGSKFSSATFFFLLDIFFCFASLATHFTDGHPAVSEWHLFVCNIDIHLQFQSTLLFE
jgi:hypothetical protein